MMTDVDFIPQYQAVQDLDSGSVRCVSPSNIALIKYWGKYPIQRPANSSISFTLSVCHTSTEIYFERRKTVGDDYDISFFFEGNPHKDFREKILTFFDRIVLYLPFLKEYSFQIQSMNSFPHSSGIASSASSMSALAGCLMQIEQQLYEGYSPDYIIQKTSFLARLGSGSACRSVWGGLVSWGEHPELEGSTDYYATPLDQKRINPIFDTYQDTILLVDKGVKSVSSSLGHQIMETHPYREPRYQQSKKHLSDLLQALSRGDTVRFAQIVEGEALSLHGLMMSSMPYFLLMRPHTLSIIQAVWDYRRQTDSALCFTLDAGANVHLLYPLSEKEAIQSFIRSELVVFCQNQEYICDCVGRGIHFR